MSTKIGYKVHITGIVQGVGFRPFVYSLADRYHLTGWVKNTSAGVDIEVEGESTSLESFIQAVKTETPPLGRIDTFTATPQDTTGYTTFQILHSDSNPGDFIPVSPDVSICRDCLRELYDPTDRRYHYPFINCTNCGPRFTVIQDIPYDRPNTTMAEFMLCPDCDAEYNDPTDRRFHAQPVACAKCGPAIWLEYTSQGDKPDHLNSSRTKYLSSSETDEIIKQAQRLIANGNIVAIKGLGGFHLACDATNQTAVTELRTRKLRVDKPFAVMMPDIETVEKHCYLDEVEKALLESRQRPILILQRRPESNIDAQVSPGQDTVGVMLPYTPLHYLLFTDFSSSTDRFTSSVYVMTSGNLSEEPIATDNEDARQRLSCLCDAFLMHNRPIWIRCDDSVIRTPLVPSSKPSNISLKPDSYLLPLRRSRGYAPDPVRLPFEIHPILGVGPELKNTFCLARGPYAFISHHIGDLENYETLQSFEKGIEHYQRLFRIQPSAIAYDLHPNYLATRYALDRGQNEALPVYGIQHHHAHIAACMADNGLSGDEPVIGIALDGTGFGTDGHIWGGEFLISNYRHFQRAAHLTYMPLPGGDTAIRQPWRTALSWLYQHEIEWSDDLAPVIAGKLGDHAGINPLLALKHQIDRRINAPITSSTGRLFDAAAALAGVRQEVNYEAQAAIEFEALADPDETGCYPFNIAENKDGIRAEVITSSKTYEIDSGPLLHNLVMDLRYHTPSPRISARFHNGLAQMICDVANLLRHETGLSQIALSGGVWQNTTLLTKSVVLLQKNSFDVLIHHQVPPNDGGISLGQVVIGNTYLANLDEPPS